MLWWCNNFRIGNKYDRWTNLQYYSVSMVNDFCVLYIFFKWYIGLMVWSRNFFWQNIEALEACPYGVQTEKLNWNRGFMLCLFFWSDVFHPFVLGQELLWISEYPISILKKLFLWGLSVLTVYKFQISDCKFYFGWHFMPVTRSIL